MAIIIFISNEKRDKEYAKTKANPSLLEDANWPFHFVHSFTKFRNHILNEFCRSYTRSWVNSLQQWE